MKKTFSTLKLKWFVWVCEQIHIRKGKKRTQKILYFPFFSEIDLFTYSWKAQAFSQIEFLSQTVCEWNNNSNNKETWKSSEEKNLKARSWENKIKIYAFSSPLPPKASTYNKTWPLMSRVKIDKRVPVWIFSFPKWKTHTYTFTFINFVYPFTMRAQYWNPFFSLNFLSIQFQFSNWSKEKNEIKSS